MTPGRRCPNAIPCLTTLELWGVRFISLPSAISDPAYRDDPDIAAPGGGTLLELMMQKKKLPAPEDSKPVKELDSMCR